MKKFKVTMIIIYVLIAISFIGIIVLEMIQMKF